MDEPLDLADYPLWHGAMPMSLFAQWSSPSKFLVRGNGCWVEDAGGRKYFDARAGICNVNLGYGRRDIAEAVYRQLLELPYACLIRYDRPSAIAVEYAQALTAIAPSGLKRVRLAQTGSAATETALLMTRLYYRNEGKPGKRWIISMDGSFHGATLMTMAASGEQDIQELFGPMPEGFRHVPAPFRRHCGWCSEAATCTNECVTAVERAILDLGPENVAAIIVEPVMGTRVVVPPDGYLKQIRGLCDRFDLLLIFDEVVTGFGRLGTMFAADHFGVVPDVMCLSKGISSGYAPLAAVLVKERIYAGFDAPGRPHFPNGSSTDGHPVSCAAGLAVLEAFQREDVIANGRRQAQQLLNDLRHGLEGNPLISEIRGLGLYIGIELVEPNRQPSPLARMRQVKWACERHNVLVHYTENVLILMPPLVISEEEIGLLASVVADSLNEMAREPALAGR